MLGEAIRFGEREQLSYTYGKAYLNEMGNALVQLHLTNDNQYMRWFYSTVYITIRLEPTNKEQLLDKLLKGLRTAMKGHSKRDLLTQLIFYVGGIGQSDETIRPEQLFPYLTIALNLHFSNHPLNNKKNISITQTHTEAYTSRFRRDGSARIRTLAFRNVEFVDKSI